MKKHRCIPCGWIYDPAIGDPENGIAAGTPFEELPEDWACPLCGADKESFEEVFKKAYKVKEPAVIDLTIKTDSVVLPMLKPGGTFNNLILRREDISDAEK